MYVFDRLAHYAPPHRRQQPSRGAAALDAKNRLGDWSPPAGSCTDAIPKRLSSLVRERSNQRA